VSKVKGRPGNVATPQMAAPDANDAAPVVVKEFAEDVEKSETSWTTRLYLPAAIILCVIVCTGALVLFGWTTFVESLFSVVEGTEHKSLQALVINTVLVIMIVCCLPGPAFCVMLDGFFFGFWKGFALGWIGELIGYVICVALARTCLKDRMRQWILESEMLREMLMVCEEDATGKFLVLFRFISLPVWAKNYAIGMLDLEWPKTILVFIPAETFYAAIFAYIGSKSYVIADALRKGDTQKAMDSFSGVEVAIVGVSMLGAVLISLFGWREYRIRRDAIAEGSRGEAAPLAAAKKAAV